MKVKLKLTQPINCERVHFKNVHHPSGQQKYAPLRLFPVWDQSDYDEFGRGWLSDDKCRVEYGHCPDTAVLKVSGNRNLVLFAKEKITKLNEVLDEKLTEFSVGEATLVGLASSWNQFTSEDLRSEFGRIMLIYITSGMAQQSAAQIETSFELEHNQGVIKFGLKSKDFNDLGTAMEVFLWTLAGTFDFWYSTQLQGVAVAG